MRLARLLLLLLLPLAGCFVPDQPLCTFRCGPEGTGGNRCPESYFCDIDDRCHLNGSSGACPGDASAAVDLSEPDDGSGPDAGGDGAEPPDAGDGGGAGGD